MEVFMKSWKWYWVLVMTAAVLSSFLTACGKKDSGSTSGLASGSLRSDGQTVSSSNSTVEGIPLSLSISGITMGYGGSSYGGYGYTQPYYGYGYGQQQQQGGSVMFSISANGMSGQLQTQGINWSSYQSLSQGGYGGGYGYSQYGAQQLYVSSASTCYDASCTNVLLGVIVTVSGRECKEIVIRKNLSSNLITNIREYQGPCTTSAYGGSGLQLSLQALLTSI